jgi:DNA adenine methylase
MILKRLGNKTKLAKEIQKYFPPHSIYIEPFFGAGGMFFNKPKAKHNILNDLDSDVFNLFRVVMDRKEELKESFYLMPIHSDLLEYWKVHKEEEPIKKALRFLLMSNYTYLGKGGNLNSAIKNEKKYFNENLKLSFSLLESSKFYNNDFRIFLKNLSFRTNSSEKQKTFIYCDPPYLGTSNNYQNGFTKEDFNDLISTLKNTGCKFAVSEFYSPYLEDKAKEEGLNLHLIKERQSLKNRNTEILLTNYNLGNTLF